MVKTLGHGGFGSVYLATGDQSGRLVALKVAFDSDEAREQLRREAAVLTGLEGVGAPRVLHDSSSEDVPFLVTELIPGVGLDEAMADGSVVPGPNAVKIGRALVRAVYELHRAGVAHGDLKPENVLVEADVCRLIDFGLARRTGTVAAPEGAVTTTQTAFDRVVGTAEYMAPELEAGGRPIDERSDVYALGAILFELVSGRPPFFGSGTDVRLGHRAQRVRGHALRDVPSGMRTAILRALEKNPVERFPSAVEMADALDGSVSLLPPPPTSVRGTGLEVPTGRILVASGSRALVALLAVAEDRATENLTALVEARWGELVAKRANCLVFAWPARAARHPVEAAVACARELLASGALPRALVDFGYLSMSQRAGGRTAYGGPLLGSVTKGCAALDTDGVSLTAAAVDASRFASGRSPTSSAPRHVVQPLDVLEAEQGRLVEPELLERARTLAAIDVAAVASRGGPAHLVTVIGGAGVGKSAIVRALERRLADRTVNVLQGRSSEDVSLRAFLALLGGLSEVAPAAEIASALAEKADLSTRETHLAACVLGLGASDALDLPAHGFRAALAELIVKLILLPGMPPTALLVDDAHLLPPVLLDVLELVTTAGVNAPLLVVVAALPSFERSRPAWSLRASACVRVELEALSAEAAMQLAATLLQPADQVPEEALLRLAERADHNPRALTELVAFLKRSKGVRKRGTGGAYYLALEVLAQLPDRSREEWLAEEQIQGLAAPLATLASALAALGARALRTTIDAYFDDLDATGLGVELTLDLSVGLRCLLEEGILEGDPRGAIAFRTPFHRHALLGRLDPAFRAGLYETAYRTTRHVVSLDDAGACEQLAELAAACSRTDEAIALLDRVLLARSRTADFVALERACSRYLELASASPALPTASVLRKRAIARVRTERVEDASRDLLEARERAKATGDREEEARALLDHALALDRLGEYPRAAELVNQAVVVAKDLPSDLLGAEFELARGLIECRTNAMPTAIFYIEEAIRRASVDAAAHYEALIFARVMLPYLYAGLARLDEAERAFEEADRFAIASGDADRACSNAYNRHLLDAARHDYASYKQTLTRASELSARHGLASVLVLALGALAIGLIQNRDLDEADRCLTRARRVALHIGAAMRLFIVGLEARCSFFGGDEPAARERLLEMRSEIASGSALSADYARTMVDALDLALERAPADSWERLIAEVTLLNPPEDVLDVLLLRAEAERRSGTPEAALRTLERALETASVTPNVARDFLREETIQLRTKLFTA